MSMKTQIISFCVMFIVGILFNPMNMLAYRSSDLYLSLTLFYSGLLMASNMIWAHEIIHFITMGMFNVMTFIVGIMLSLTIIIILLRDQLFINDKQWLRRMIGHHSTAITTTSKLLEKPDVYHNSKLYRFAKDIIYNQEREIKFMKLML